MEEQRLDDYLKRIRQIDDILFPAIKSLIEIAAKEAPRDDPLRENVDKPIFFPPWVSDHTTAPTGPYLLTRAVCSGTLLRIWRIRRRFPRLFEKKEVKEIFKELGDLRGRLPAAFTPKPNNSEKFDDCIPLLDSKTFGPLNPLTATCVFSVLMDGGEELTHSGIGFLACFAMLWSLYQKFPDDHASGARLDPWGPSAYVTAKCLVPLRSLEKLSRRRARSIEQLKDLLSNLNDHSSKGTKENNPYTCWKFVSTLDAISGLLYGASQIAIDPEAMKDCSKNIRKLATDWNGLDYGTTCNEVVQALHNTLTTLSKKRRDCADKAQAILNEIEIRILNNLECASKAKSEKICLSSKISLRLPREWTKQDKYWETLTSAARCALKDCREARQKIVDASDYSPDGVKSVEELQQRLDGLKKAHEGLAQFLYDKLRTYAHGCLRIVQREIAHISAQNQTDFDPSELVNAILVAVGWEEMRSELEVKDAAKQAITAGARQDGSWVSGQPFYTFGRALTVVPTTSDIVWPLATAVMAKPKINVADEAFARYVDWLERTQLKVMKARLANEGHPVEVTGWASDRARGPHRIDLWATALAINALLEIRDIFEYRLWQLCEECYTVLRVDDQGLDKIEPVDLKESHEKRLHRQLSQIFCDAQQDTRGKARYAFVLYGPPGSSKTSIASALAAEIWRPPGAEEKECPRFVRITPADFTRHGEARLDWEARLICELLQGLRRVTVFFDEIDDLLHRRNPKKDPTFMKLIVPAMLNRLQDLRDACPQQEVCVIFATNHFEQIERALLRKGRVDDCFLIGYPDQESRRLIVWRNIDKHDGRSAKVNLLKSNMEFVVVETDTWPWKYLNELCERFLQEDSEATVENLARLITEYRSQLNQSRE